MKRTEKMNNTTLNQEVDTMDTEDLDRPSEEQEELKKISELSKRGYQYLKENLLSEAEGCFQEIIESDDTNNYEIGRAHV